MTLHPIHVTAAMHVCLSMHLSTVCANAFAEVIDLQRELWFRPDASTVTTMTATLTKSYLHKSLILQAQTAAQKSTKEKVTCSVSIQQE